MNVIIIEHFSRTCMDKHLTGVLNVVENHLPDPWLTVPFPAKKKGFRPQNHPISTNFPLFA